MASANLDLVRSIFAAWEHGDFRSADWAHPAIELVRPDGPSTGRWTGLTGMADGTRDWLNVWEDMRFDVDEYRELDDERVLVLVRSSGPGKTSGLELGQIAAKSASLFHLRAGKVTRLVHCMDRERALAGVGLPSDAGSPGPSLPSHCGGIGAPERHCYRTRGRVQDSSRS